MKWIASLLLLTTALAHAETPEVRASQVSCEELKAAVANYGSIKVVKKVLFFKSKTLVHSSADCSGEYTYTVHPRFKTMDVKDCQAGVFCEYSPPYEPSTSSGSSTDYGGSTGWGGSSGWGSGSGSSGSDRGSSYDPPSRGDRGSSYDPPSSSDRGSRYCPGC